MTMMFFAVNPYSLLMVFFQFIFSVASLPGLFSSEQVLIQNISLENPILQFGPASCQRVHLTGMSRLNLKFYASSVRAVLKISEATPPDKFSGKIHVCFHRNSSIGLCECEEEAWESLKNTQWSSVMSPYENKFIEIRMDDKISTSFTASLEEEFQKWRLVCLGFGFLFLLVAPVISSWVPFYYSSSMALGVFLVVLIILFQGMKLLPTGRKNILYLTIYGSVLGLASFIAHNFSTLVNSLLVSFGLSEELHNPVLVFLVVGIILAGAALGYFIVRKFVLSEDGSVDAGIAQFVKWAMRLIGVVLILQSTLDVPLALAATGVFWYLCSLINPKKERQTLPANGSPWQQKATQPFPNKRAQFLSPTSKETGRGLWGSSKSNSLAIIPAKAGKSNLSWHKPVTQQDDYYSTYHKMPRRKFSKKEWENFTQDSTRTALREWASTPDVARWLADNAFRIGPDQGRTALREWASTPDVARWLADNALRIPLDQGNCSSSADTAGGSLDSEETEVENGGGMRFFNWL